MCPLCLTTIPLSQKTRISDAHIIPKAAKGKLETYLCSKCNSTLGSKQDKWFGEYIRLSNLEIPTLPLTTIKDGYFWIDNIKVNGHWEADINKGISLYINKDRNSPETNKIIEKMRNLKNLRLPMPIMRNKRMINVGFLTAAYLMWFRALGYSWVFQFHLNKFREQILNPQKEILDAFYIARINGLRWDSHWIGITTIADEMFPTVGLEDHVIFFPSAYNPEGYSKLENLLNSQFSIKDLNPLQFSWNSVYGPPVFLLYENKLVVQADNAQHLDFSKVVTIVFTSESQEGQLMSPITKEEFDKKTKLPSTKVFRATRS